MILRELVTIFAFAFVLALAIVTYYAEKPKGTVQPIDPQMEITK